MLANDLENARNTINQYSSDGGCVVQLCGDILFNFTCNPEQQRDGLVEFYRQSLELLNNRLRFIKNGENARWKPLSKDPSNLLEAWFAKPNRKTSHVLALEGSKLPNSVSDTAFEFSWVLGAGYIRLILPAEALAEDAERFRSKAIELASLVKFSSGTAGYSVNIHLDHDTTNENCAISEIGGRFLGVDLGKPLYWSDLVVHGLKTINWLTFLGPDFVLRAAADKPDYAAFLASLGPQAHVNSLGQGLVIQAGAQACLGDQADADLLAYRQVARALHLLKIPPHILRGYDGIGGTESTRRWLDRYSP